MKQSHKRSTFNYAALLSLLIGGIWVITNCSSDNEAPRSKRGSSSSGSGVNNYCVYSATQQCFEGSYATCPGTGGIVNDTCPYDSDPGTSQEYDYCVFAADKSCLDGPVTSCPPGGTPSNTCPYGSSSSSSIGTSVEQCIELTGNVFTDTRDGKEYNFVVAPNGRIWMSENLNYSKGNTLGHCYNMDINSHENGVGCDGGYGRAYEWQTAMNGNSSQGLCPAGWYIPSTDEWSSVGSMPSNFYIKAGNYDDKNGWKDRGTYGFYWTSTAGKFAFIEGTTSKIDAATASTTTDYFSVRCIANTCCNGKGYSFETEFCSNNKVYSKCGAATYNPATQFCFGTTVLALCSNKEYNNATEFCYDDEIYNKCGATSLTYNPLTQECINSTLYNKCGSDKYLDATKFCYDNTVYNKCGPAFLIYDPIWQGCENNVVVNTMTIDKYVTIGSQTWMAEDLKLHGSSCFNSAELTDIICPAGWHLPSSAEWTTLITTVGGSSTAGAKLKETSGWRVNGTDDYGFSAKPLDCSGNDLWCSSSGDYKLWIHDHDSGVELVNWGGACAVRCLMDQ